MTRRSPRVAGCCCPGWRPGTAPPRRDLDHFDARARQRQVQRCGELPGPIADEEPKSGGGTFAEVHEEGAGLLGGPEPARVSGHAHDVQVADAGALTLLTA